MCLNSITIPCTVRDRTAFAQLLSYWSDDRFFPLTPSDRSNPIPLVVVLNRATSTDVATFKDIFSEHSKLRSVFSNCIIADAQLDGDRDLYAKNQTDSKGIYGNKAGPNFLFFETMRIVHALGGFTFQNEVDCYPLRPGWLSELRNIIDERKYAWIIGSYYTGEYPVGPEIQYHFNGNAVYQSGSPKFMSFLNEIWEPRILQYVDIDPNLAYDCWWALECSRASSVIRNTSWQIVTTYSQFMCNHQFLINTLHEETAARDASLSLDSSSISNQPCLFIHGHAATKLVEEFFSGSASDFSAFLQARGAEERKKASILSSSSQIDATPELSENGDRTATEWTTITALVSTKDDNALVTPPVSVKTLPIVIQPKTIPDESFVGQWYTGSQMTDNHIWSGAGASALTFSFEEPVRSLTLAIHGSPASGLSLDNINFQLFGTSKNEMIEKTEKRVVFVAESDKTIDSILLLIDVEGGVRLEGDSRLLGYALFSVSVQLP